MLPEKKNQGEEVGVLIQWNGNSGSGMNFFRHPFCLLVCLLTIILRLSFSFPALSLLFFAMILKFQ